VQPQDWFALETKDHTAIGWFFKPIGIRKHTLKSEPRDKSRLTASSQNDIDPSGRVAAIAALPE
jgi:hypothetical protein